MGGFYINKITDRQYPNIMRDINSGRLKSATPLRHVWQIIYQGRSLSSVKPLGWRLTLKEAVQFSKDYALRRFRSKNPVINIQR